MTAGYGSRPALEHVDLAIEPEVVGKYRAGDIRHCFCDTTLAQEKLGFEARQATAIHAGVFRIYSSRIRRSDQGGYGSFSPSSVEWDASVAGPPQ